MTATRSDDGGTASDGEDDAGAEENSADAAGEHDLSDAGDNPAPDAGSADTIPVDVTDDQDLAGVTDVSSAN